MSSARTLVTGGLGCIGSETTKWLIRNTDHRVVVASRNVDAERADRIFHDVDMNRIDLVSLDVRDQIALERLLKAHRISHVVHMAALQTPDCNAHRDLGLQINLAGTQNLIEAMKAAEHRIQRFVFASSVAVYGAREHYPPGRVPMLSEPDPVNVYGAWKLAGEQIAKLFHLDSGIPTICLRPGVLFGPGRDAGLTSAPTTAMKHVAFGLPYEIPFCSRQDYLFAPDVGAAVGCTLVDDFTGFGRFTLPSHTVDSYEFVAAIDSAVKSIGLAAFGIAAAPRISVGQAEVPFICDLEFDPFLQAFPTAPHTPFNAAVQKSIEVFLELAHRGWLTKPAAG